MALSTINLVIPSRTHQLLIKLDLGQWGKGVYGLIACHRHRLDPARPKKHHKNEQSICI